MGGEGSKRSENSCYGYHDYYNSKEKAEAKAELIRKNLFKEAPAIKEHSFISSLKVNVGLFYMSSLSD
jgi:hypothetical protein